LSIIKSSTPTREEKRYFKQKIYKILHEKKKPTRVEFDHKNYKKKGTKANKGRERKKLLKKKYFFTKVK
jgi:predicted DsbA family dithiol-disulfide isomerase